MKCSSDWFYDKKLVGNRIKSPVELLAGIQTHTGGTYNNPLNITYLQKALGQVLLQRPNVSGWPNGKEWIDSSVVGGIQDEVLRAYSNASNHDGMMQRMMIFPCRPRVKGEDRPNNQSFGHNYDRLIRGLYALPHYPGYTVKMADGAHRVREAFYEKLFALEEAIPNKFAKTTIGKWHGQFARMLLVYHCIDCYTENTHPLATPASESNAIKVAKLFMNVLLPATIKFYGQFDNAEDKARDIASLILAKGWTRFTERRDLSINMKAYLGWKP